MNKLVKIVALLSKPKVIAIFASLYLIFILSVFPSLENKMENAQVIDLAFAYSSDEVYTWIEAYGEDRRSTYLVSVVTVDLAYPLIYASLFIGILGFFNNARRVNNLEHSIFLSLSPSVILAFDLLENTGIVTMLTYYPERLPNIALLTSCFTTIKWIAAGLVLLFTFYSALSYAITKAKS